MKYYVSKSCPYWSRKRNERFKFHRHHETKGLQVFDKQKMEWITASNNNIPALREMNADEIQSTQKGLF